jgi:hypothetical protein
MRSITTMLLYLIRLMNLKDRHLVEPPEAHEAALKWSFDIGSSNKNGRAKTVKNLPILQLGG